MGRHSPLQGIFPTQGLNPGLLYCRQILYHLSHQGRLKWIILLLLLSRFSRVRLCATPQMAAHQAPPSLGFSRQEHWSGLPVPSPMHENENWKWNRSVMSDSVNSVKAIVSLCIFLLLWLILRINLKSKFNFIKSNKVHRIYLSREKHNVKIRSAYFLKILELSSQWRSSNTGKEDI